MKLCGKLNYAAGIWQEGSASKVSFDAVIPLFAVPMLLLIASHNLFCTLFIFTFSPMFIYYVHRNFLRFFMRTKFFCTWTITSVLLLIIIYEVSVVPLLEILPEENLVLISFAGVGIVCAYKTRQNADQATQEINQELELGEENRDICNLCRRRTPSRAFHCRICQTCIFAREYHCKWLDCCIGTNNLQWYLACLFFSATAFIYNSNLTMTTICHPFLFIGSILLPDDCSDVYYQLDTAVCFVSSIYSLLIGLVEIYYLFYHLWLIYLGTTANERRLFLNENQHSKEASLKNTKRLLCC